MVEQRIGGGRDVDGSTGEGDGGDVVATARQRLGAHAAPGDRRLEVIARERLALVAERLGFGGRPCARSVRPSRAAARAASMPSPWVRNPSYATRRLRSAATLSPSIRAMSPVNSSVSRSP